jgi:hypothetical protein
MRIELEALEVVAFGDIQLGRRRQIARPGDGLSVGIEQHEVAEERDRLGLQHLMSFRRRHLRAERLRRGDLGNPQLLDHVRGDDVGILELLIEMAGEQQNGVLQLALAVGEGALAVFTDHHDGAGEDR